MVRQIFTQAKPLVEKLKVDNILISGGLANIKNVERYAGKIFGTGCVADKDG